MCRVTATQGDTATTTDTHRKVWYRRVGDASLWIRDTGLGTFGVALLVVVAGAGWGGSTIGLHDFAVAHMSYTGWAAWLVPVAFDGASVGLSISAFRASVNGRGAPLIRLGIVAFTSLSAGMNFIRIDDFWGRRIAALLPVAGVILLESLLSEARRAYERRHGVAVRPRIHPLRPIFGPIDTIKIMRSWVMAIPLPPAMTTPTVTQPVVAVRTDSAATPASDALPRSATVTPILRSPGSANGGAKTAAMRSIFDTHVAEGRIADLNGSKMAALAGASEALGRRHFPRWLAELGDTGTATAGGAQ